MMDKNSNKQTITYSRVIHLSHIIDTDIPQWPGDPSVELNTVTKIETHGYYLRLFSLGEHSATHINAPNSFFSTGASIDEYAAESLVIPAIVIDIREKAENNPDYCLNVADILTWEREFGQIPVETLVLLYTGWQNKWNNHGDFFGLDQAGNIHFPGFGYDAVEFLINQRQIVGVGIDTHGVDSGQDMTFRINKLILERSTLVLENLTNLDQLPPKNITLIIGILRLRGGSGSPASVLALF